MINRAEILDSAVATINYGKMVKEDGYMGVLYNLLQLIDNSKLTVDEQISIIENVVEQLRYRMSLYYDGENNCYINTGLSAKLMSLCALFESSDSISDVIEQLEHLLNTLEFDDDGYAMPNRLIVEDAFADLHLSELCEESMRSIIVHINCVGLHSEKYTSDLSFYTMEEGYFIASISLFGNRSPKRIKEDILYEYGRVIGMANYGLIERLVEPLGSFDFEEILDISGKILASVLTGKDIKLNSSPSKEELNKIVTGYKKQLLRVCL